ncbi:trimethylamine methyltransferase family protein [Jannaschia sp. Os4]|uniref:trimethylamine methyltransferase family protein n=1 Tax=Jannaschia sp. Os4 TaxID=2807617 RepID=UPI00193A7339|nr:trimethylamine methyltransferase family protein [Jannaschia sp. Os4]MBM2576700.1 trimethylamine methyltransferase family protein [Jannaschia sp. Os4]
MSLDLPPRSRPGGRAARRAARAAALPDHMRPVRAGLTGGTYRPLSDADVARIHATALDALAQIGLADAPPSGVEILVGAGAVPGADGRLRFPRALVEDMLAIAARDVVLHGRDGAHDLTLSDARVHYGTAGAAVHYVDMETGAYRDSTLADLHEAARLAHALDNVHFLQRPMVARDMEGMLALDLNTIHACVTGTTKHVGTSFSDPSTVEPCLRYLRDVAGGDAAWRARPFVSNSNCFVVPPMKFATDACLIMEQAIRGGMPVLLLSAGQAGATAPAPIAGAVVQAVAECLAGVVYVNAMAPGHPAVFGTWPFVSDLRTGAMSGGSGEQALLSAACAQMGRFYGLPCGAAAGMADAKLPDMQAGWEQGMSDVLAGLAGLNMVYEAAGMHGSLMGFCPESLILGDDMIGAALRCVRGVEVTEETCSLEAMREVCLGGPGHYLGTEATLAVMQTEYLYPALADRSSPKEWAERDRPDLVAAARARKLEILAGPNPAALDPALEARLRADHPALA